MNPLVIVAIVAGGLLLFALVFVVLPKRMIAAMRGPLEARVKLRYPQGAIEHAEYAANCFGLESAGKLAWRGNGALVLTDKELCFFQFLPAKELVIDRTRIVEVTFVRSHMGKATPFKLLRIGFEAEGGRDAAAWWLRDPQTFRNLLDPAGAEVSSGSR